MAAASRNQELFGPLQMTWTACVSAVKEAVAGRSLHVMVLLQEIKKLFGPHLDDLDCVSAVKVPWSCR